MAQQPVASVPAGDSSDPLSGITFRSLLPTLDSLLAIVHDQSMAEVPPSSVEASEQVAVKARELASALEEMRNAAINLPGGDLSTDQIRAMCTYLEGEAAKRKAILEQFGAKDMPSVDTLGQRTIRAVTGEESVIPTPVRE